MTSPNTRTFWLTALKAHLNGAAIPDYIPKLSLAKLKEECQHFGMNLNTVVADYKREKGRHQRLAKAPATVANRPPAPSPLDLTKDFDNWVADQPLGLTRIEKEAIALEQLHHQLSQQELVVRTPDGVEVARGPPAGVDQRRKMEFYLPEGMDVSQLKITLEFKEPAKNGDSSQPSQPISLANHDKLQSNSS